MQLLEDCLQLFMKLPHSEVKEAVLIKTALFLVYASPRAMVSEYHNRHNSSLCTITFCAERKTVCLKSRKIYGGS